MQKIDLGTISMGNSDPGEYEPYQNAPDLEQAETSVREARRSNVKSTQEYLTRNDIYYGRCEDTKDCEFGEMSLDGQGRILDVSLTLRNVCPGKRVAVGIVLTEVDENNREYPRGQKIVSVPAHNSPTCRDIPVSNMRFVMPEDISVSGSDDMCCNCRHFIARVAAHYIDTTSNHCCCEEN